MPTDRELMLKAYQAEVASRPPDRPKSKDEAFQYLIGNGEKKLVDAAIENGMSDEEIIDAVHDIMLADAEDAQDDDGSPPGGDPNVSPSPDSDDDGELKWEHIFGEPRPEPDEDEDADWEKIFGEPRSGNQDAMSGIFDGDDDEQHYRDPTAPTIPGDRGNWKPPAAKPRVPPALKTIPFHGTTDPNEYNHHLAQHGASHLIWPDKEGNLAFHPRAHVEHQLGEKFDIMKHALHDKNHLGKGGGSPQWVHAPFNGTFVKGKFHPHSEGDYQHPKDVYGESPYHLTAKSIVQHLGSRAPKSIIDTLEPHDHVDALGTDSDPKVLASALKRVSPTDYRAVAQHLGVSGMSQPHHFGRLLGAREGWEVGVNPGEGGLQVIAAKKGERDKTIARGLLTREQNDNGRSPLVMELKSLAMHKKSWDKRKAIDHLADMVANLQVHGVDEMHYVAKTPGMRAALEKIGFRPLGTPRPGSDVRMRLPLEHGTEDFERFLEEHGHDLLETRRQLLRGNKPIRYEDEDLNDVYAGKVGRAEERAKQAVAGWRQRLEELADMHHESPMYHDRLFDLLHGIDSHLYGSSKTPVPTGATVKHLMDMAQEMGVANPPKNTREILKAIADHTQAQSQHVPLIDWHVKRAEHLGSLPDSTNNRADVYGFYRRIPHEHAHRIAKRLGVEPVAGDPKETRYRIAMMLHKKQMGHPAKQLPETPPDKAATIIPNHAAINYQPPAAG